MPKAVRLNHYGDVDVLNVVEVERPTATQGQALVHVVAAGTNPGEIALREGLLDEMFPTTFPSGQGTDFAGVVAELGEGVSDPEVGKEVIGWTNERAAQAEFVAVPADQLVVKPESLDWNVAGAIYAVAATATAAVSAVSSQPGETVLVSGAAGGVGSLVSQLVLRTGASVIGAAGSSHHDWLRSIGVTPVDYETDLREDLRRAAPDGIDAMLDCVGSGYVDLAIELGVEPGRINTIIDFAGAAKHEGVHTDASAEGEDAGTLAEVASLVAAGELQVPITAVYDLDDVRQAYTQLAEGHTGGKIVLRVAAPL